MSAAVIGHPFRDVFALQDWLVGHRNTAPLMEAPTSIYEDIEGLTLSMDVPGFTADRIHVAVEDDHLTISGDRIKEKHEHTTLNEQPSGKFARSFVLSPRHDLSRLEASVKHGILTIRIPKREEAKPRQIKVKVTGD